MCFFIILVFVFQQNTALLIADMLLRSGGIIQMRVPLLTHSTLGHTPDTRDLYELWSGTTKSPDVSTGPLAYSFATSLGPLTHSLAPHCLLCATYSALLALRCSLCTARFALLAPHCSLRTARGSPAGSLTPKQGFCCCCCCCCCF